MVTKQEISGKWNSITGAVKKKYGQITDDELSQVEGDTDQLIGLIQQKTGQGREQVEAFLSEACQNCDSHSGNFSEMASEYAETASETFREGYEQVARRAREGYEQSAEVLAQRPLESVVAALGVGLITGIAIGISIASHRQPEPSWRDRWSR
ncbi:CsbD family protein [Novipirellula caenicola]|uniref:CsbD-like domain-containing protein n=1 Tax=Novipirellula caenicola TaxID=1536901 RepID=A0ABP9VKZ7_9BACT